MTILNGCYLTDKNEFLPLDICRIHIIVPDRMIHLGIRLGIYIQKNSYIVRLTCSQQMLFLWKLPKIIAVAANSVGVFKIVLCISFETAKSHLVFLY